MHIFCRLLGFTLKKCDKVKRLNPYVSCFFHRNLQSYNWTCGKTHLENLFLMWILQKFAIFILKNYKIFSRCTRNVWKKWNFPLSRFPRDFSPTRIFHKGHLEDIFSMFGSVFWMISAFFRQNDSMSNNEHFVIKLGYNCSFFSWKVVTQ